MQIYGYFVAVFYAFMGMLGTALIEDEFSSYTINAAAFIGVPAATISALLVYYRSHFWHDSLTIRTFLIASLITGFGPGVIAGINAVTADQDQVVQRSHIGQTIFLTSKRLGGLGYLYKPRF
jgi:hypothetical protein